MTISCFGPLVTLFRRYYSMDNMLTIYAFLQSKDSEFFLFLFGGNKIIVLNTTKAHICSYTSCRLFWLPQLFKG